MKLRIHHFYDIIRDFGSRKDIKPHPYGHSYHKVAELIRKNPALEIEIIVGVDDVCNGCVHLNYGNCDDIINHGADFSSKEEFNDFIDKRILGACLVKEGEILTPLELCTKAALYLENIETIYLGNDIEHTKKRKNNVIKGLDYYLRLHK